MYALTARNSFALETKVFICRKVQILKYLTFTKQSFFSTVEYEGDGIFQNRSQGFTIRVKDIILKSKKQF